MVNGACLTMAINGWNFLVQIYYIPSFYQLVYGYSAVRSATLLLPITLMQSKLCGSAMMEFVLTIRSRYEHSFRTDCTLDWPLPGMYPFRMGMLGDWSGSVFHPR